MGALLDLKSLNLGYYCQNCVRGNSLSGSLPSTLSSLTMLAYLGVLDSGLCGSLPAALSSLGSLKVDSTLPACPSFSPPPLLSSPPPPLSPSPPSPIVHASSPPPPGQHQPPPLPPPGVTYSTLLPGFTCTTQDATCAALGDLYAATSGPSTWTNNRGWAAAAAGAYKPGQTFCFFSKCLSIVC